MGAPAHHPQVDLFIIIEELLQGLCLIAWQFSFLCLNNSFIFLNLQANNLQGSEMASEAPGWADQWGAGGIGALEDENKNKSVEDNNKKKGETKSGLNKAKVAAMAGAEKIKSGTTNGIKWIKNQCQKKKSTKTSTEV